MVTTWGSFYKDGLTLILIWISNHMPSKVWDEITYPFPKFNNHILSLTTPLFLQKFIQAFSNHPSVSTKPIQANNKETKVFHYWIPCPGNPPVGGLTAEMATSAKSMSMLWLDYDGKALLIVWLAKKCSINVSHHCILKYIRTLASQHL